MHPALFLGSLLGAKKETAWPSGLSAGLAIRRPRVQVPPGLLAGFVYGSAEFKSSPTLFISFHLFYC